MSGPVDQTLEALNRQFGRAGAVVFETRFGGSVAVLTAGGAAAVVALQGAQVLSYVPAAGGDALWLSPNAQLGTGKAVRGGIPVCWPWFGPHPDDAVKPAHGFVRAAVWRVVQSSVTEGACELIMAFDATEIDPALWLHQAVAILTVRLGAELSVTLRTENRGSSSIALTQALHTYLAAGDVGCVSIAGLEGRAYIDQLDRAASPVQSGPVRFTGETDRIYYGTQADVIVSDTGLGRTIEVARSGSSSAVVWNPWIDKGERLGDLGPQGYRRMVCVETCNAGPDVVTLAPGAHHQLTQTLRVRNFAVKS